MSGMVAACPAATTPSEDTAPERCDPSPTSREMIALVERMPDRSTRHGLKAGDTGARLMASLPRLTGLGDDLRIGLSLTPGRNLRVDFRLMGQNASLETARVPNWKQIEELFEGVSENLVRMIVMRAAYDFRRDRGFVPVWSWRGDVLLRDMIAAAGMTTQEYHDAVFGDPRSHAYGMKLNHRRGDHRPMFRASGQMMSMDGRLDSHQIQTTSAGRYDLGYWELSPDIGWRADANAGMQGFILKGQMLPETVRTMVQGCPIGKIIGHPALGRPDMVVRRIVDKPTSVILIVDPMRDWMADLPDDVRSTVDSVEIAVRSLVDHHRPAWAEDRGRAMETT